ncbi:MAG: Protein tyrosine/serine phosphatase [Crocinitomicaceae bacterium]|jgi:protein tyrosine/serine phosphatase|nr:Protein tyrosine/serine phosphatase [Crocinitomicaceae bacterium]
MKADLKNFTAGSIFSALAFLGFSQKIESVPNGKTDFANLYKINDSIYRGEQPTSAGMQGLQQLGIKSVLNLRFFSSDRSEVKNSSIKAYKEGVNAWVMSESELIEALELLIKSEKPVYVHCKHGSDRTGTIIAAYRIVFENRSKEDAIAEMLRAEYGFHPCFQNLIHLLEHLDVDRVKRELGLI